MSPARISAGTPASIFSDYGFVQSLHENSSIVLYSATSAFFYVISSLSFMSSFHPTLYNRATVVKQATEWEKNREE
jgi:hypothetical protein